MAAKRLKWSEPWDWPDAKARAREMAAVLPPLRRMALYCVALPAACFAVAIWRFPELASPRFYGQISACVFAICVLHGLPFLVALCPRAVVLRTDGIGLVQGNSMVNVPLARIVSLSLAEDRGRRVFVIRISKRAPYRFGRWGAARAKAGAGEERVEKIVLSPKVTEDEIVRFLYEAGLAHLYRP